MTLVPSDISPTSAAPTLADTNATAVPTTISNNSDQFGSYGKPNAIVRPQRRNELNNEMIQSSSQPPLPPPPPSSTHMHNGNVARNDESKRIQRDVEFSSTKELDFKLKHGQGDKKASSKNSSNGILDQVPNRPRFVCTVPTGVYLQPTRELPPLKHPNASNDVRTYAYFSIPKVFAQRSNEGPITEIHAIQAMASSLYSKPINKRETPSQPQNIMYDKRVVRGSNYSQAHMQVADYENTTKEAEAHRRQQLRKQYILRKKRGIIGSPPPVKGRRHETVQTERYLEELLARPIEHSAECQTDLYLNPVPEPPYIPTKNGIDASTHIEEGDLFDFDAEVEPILDSLINLTVKLAMEEVVHEEQMADLRREKERYLAIREAEMAELRRLEANEIRLTSEKQRRERFEKIANDLETELRDNMSAAKLIEGHVAQLLPEILETIQTEIVNKNADELNNIFLPWLAQEVAKEVGQMVDARDILEEIVGDIMRERAAEYSRFKAEAEFNVHVDDPIDDDDDDESTARPEPANAGNDIDPL